MSVVLARVEEIIADSAIWQAQCDLDGVDYEDQILWHAYRPEFEGGVVQPGAIVRYPMCLLKISEASWQEFSPQCMNPMMTVAIHILDKTRGETHKDSAITFMNFWSQILEELATTNYASNGLIARNITQTQDPTAVKRNAVSVGKYDFWFAEGAIALGAEVI